MDLEYILVSEVGGSGVLKSEGSSPPNTQKPASEVTRSTPKGKANKESSWTPDEDSLIIRLRSEKKPWDEIAKELPKRSGIACRLRYQNYLQNTSLYDHEDIKNKLSRVYYSESRSMWKDIGADIGIPAKVAEALVWEIGEKGIEERANRLVSLPFIQSVMPSQRQGHPRPSQFQVHTRARRVPKRKADDMS
ncbi:hypothetical protein GGP41_000396 [Bipolaris sorokiniana]|uniref:Myb-like domain-containing protein n=1 Tax=Cochliobolus sativus TaxID=45130 RepID=A0A8H5Z752_COCSA|nr:hypothetical protein GGP41_000396 [Bipolaris sorokiniana]